MTPAEFVEHMGLSLTDWQREILARMYPEPKVSRLRRVLRFIRKALTWKR